MKREKAIILSSIIFIIMVAVGLVAEALLVKKVEDDYMNNKMAISLALNTHKVKHKEYEVLDYTNQQHKKIWVVNVKAINQENYYNEFIYWCGYDSSHYMYCEELL